MEMNSENILDMVIAINKKHCYISNEKINYDEIISYVQRKTLLKQKNFKSNPDEKTLELYVKMLIRGYFDWIRYSLYCGREINFRD
jgi:hypothetical protein